MMKDPQEGFLNHIMGFVSVPQTTPGEHPGLGLVPTHEILKGRKVSSCGPHHQDRVDIVGRYQPLFTCSKPSS